MALSQNSEIVTVSLKHFCVLLTEFWILVLFDGKLPGLGWLLSALWNFHQTRESLRGLLTLGRISDVLV